MEVDAARTEKLLRVYDQERQDERAYWWTTSTLMVGALAAVLVLVTAPVSAKVWGIWIVAPLFTNLVFAYHVNQSAIGVRRRVYLEALERELCIDEAPLEVDSRHAASLIRPMAYNRYSWSLASNQSEIAPQLLARFLFRAMVLVPLAILVSVEVTSVLRLLDRHSTWALIVAIVSWVLTMFLALSFWKLGDDRSRRISWSTAGPISTRQSGAA
jgi:hypothetical protein